MRAPIEPGIYKRADVDYDRIDAVNQSSLKVIAKSPLHYRHALEHPRRATDTMKLGSLTDTLLFEPHRFERDYIMWDPPPGKSDTRTGKAWEAFKLTAGDREIVRRRDVEAARNMVTALRACKLAGRYLRAGTEQPVLVWRDKATGLLCKARLDWISTSVADVMLELKTANDVAPWSFESAFAKRGYDVQCAFYADGYQTLTGRPLFPKCVAVENTPPHDVVVYDLIEVVDTGREIYREMIERLAECRKSGEWPGQHEDAEVILRLPKWRDPDDQDELAELGLEYEGAGA